MADDPDDWSSICDPKRRKQVQDRLAQRVRRKRLADKKAALQQCNDIGTSLERTIGLPDSQSSWAAVQLNAAMNCEVTPTGESLHLLFSRDGSDTSHLSAPSTSPIFPEMEVSTLPAISATDDCLLSHSNNTVFTALYKNGRLLGIPCGTQMLWKSPRCGPEIPNSLQPTLLQMTTLHTSWIDRFPFPQMRDNFIKMNAIINEEEFLASLFDTTGFTMIPGTRSWDPAGWIMGKEFGEKWGYLFLESV